MGKMIVIDGLDGSGKATQAELLKKRLKEKGYWQEQLAEKFRQDFGESL